jgi:UDP-glucose 4-epimerase
MTGSSSEIVHAAERPGDVRHSLADISRIQSLGFSPAASRTQALEETVKYFVERTERAAVVAG